MQSGFLVLDDLRISVEVGGATARRAKLTVESDGKLHLLVGAGVDEQEVQKFLESKRKWIYTRLSEKEDLLRTSVDRELVDGEGFQYLGRNYRLRIIDAQHDRVHLRDGLFEYPSILIPRRMSPMVDWYCERGRSWVMPRVNQLAERLRVVPSEVEVKELGRKWGSANFEGRIRLHWAVFQLSPGLIDYVVAHELAHLKEPHHGKEFRQVLGGVMPDHLDRKDKLAQLGTGLWLGEHSC